MTGSESRMVATRRVAVMWTHLSGYLNACLKALADTEGVELFVSNIRVADEAPYDEEQFSWIKKRYQWEGDLDADELLARLEEFRPDTIVSSGWNVPGHRHVLRKFRNRAVRLVTMDNPWLGTLKQRVGVLVAPAYLHPICDAMFVAGERQAVFAHRLGFPQGRILRGHLSCDHEKFAAVYAEHQKSGVDSCSFAYVGRFSPVKGLDVLVDAYRQYRNSSAQPWPLKCYGTGPLQGVLENVEGIEVMGFCQPRDLPVALSASGCLVLPSTNEPWALVLHEAASAGMAIICSDAVGASVHLVQDGYNGYIVETGDAAELARAMSRYAALDAGERKAMGGNSHKLSWQFTPDRWAKYLLSRTAELARSGVEK